MWRLRLIVVTFVWNVGASANLHAQHSVARQWNEALLQAIRLDLARPTVHARNLFHTSVAMYDAWAAYDATVTTYLLGHRQGDYVCHFNGVPAPAHVENARQQAISFAAYRLLTHRFLNSPGFSEALPAFDDLMVTLGYDIQNTSVDYSGGDPAALGNYIAQCLIEYGREDGSNEHVGYGNLFYQPVNAPLAPANPGNPTISDPNRWQPLLLEEFIDQSGNPVAGNTQPFLGPEWGHVLPFALTRSDLTIFERGGNPYYVYHDPGAPPYVNVPASDADYKWGMVLTSAWSSHLDPADGVMWDISPGAIGNNTSLPASYKDYPDFYDLENGGDAGSGWPVNPSTGLPYEPQLVPRGDYTRVLAEFWADGPDSETPPGHWFTILNYVNDHPLFEKRFKGEGQPLPDLEWDVKAYFTLGGAMHDAAISAWGIKGWYDYTRPISGIRYLADQGQSSNSSAPSYDPVGIPLLPGYIELVNEGDPLAGPGNEHLHKVKLKAWKGPAYIVDPETDEAGVGWILAENWWPYQRPTFVTPPFAGFVSGHSTFSRAAAEVLTLLTGSEFFPGGMGEFLARKNEFLVFEEGPSVDVKLQWATYRDASDQTSLSRIWGGIHVPCDDIPGRIIGEKVGINAFEFAEKHFNGLITSTKRTTRHESIFIQNPASGTLRGNTGNSQSFALRLYDLTGRLLVDEEVAPESSGDFEIAVSELAPGFYVLRVHSDKKLFSAKVVVR